MSDIRKVFSAVASRAPRKETIKIGDQEIVVYFRYMRLPDYAAVRGLSALTPEQRIEVMPATIARFLCDEKGTQIYNPDKQEDVDEIAGFDLEMISALAGALNGVDPTKEPEKDAKTNGEAEASPN